MDTYFIYSYPHFHTPIRASLHLYTHMMIVTLPRSLRWHDSAINRYAASRVPPRPYPETNCDAAKRRYPQVPAKQRQLKEEDADASAKEMYSTRFRPTRSIMVEACSEPTAHPQNSKNGTQKKLSADSRA